MERESFENQVVAAVMNEHYVNIKVDREERPDVDQLYMTFVQVIKFIRFASVCLRRLKLFYIVKHFRYCIIISTNCKLPYLLIFDILFMNYL